MAIDLGTATVTSNKKDRLWRAEFFIADDDTVQIRLHREEQAKDTGTNQVIARDRAKIPTVSRSQSDIATKSYTAGGVTATGQQVLQLINKMADDERQADIAAGP